MKLPVAIGTLFLLFVISVMFSVLISIASAFELETFNIEYQKSIGTNRTFLLPEDRTKKGVLAADFLTSISKYGYNFTRVESYISDRQFSYVGLKTELGINFSSFQVFVNHYSGHCMDCVYNFKYPNENSIGIRLFLFRR